MRTHILLAGDVPHDVTLRAIEQSDALLRTTLYDGDSICVREALHLGTPVIATDNGMRPLGCDLFPAEDLDGLLDVIEKRLNVGKRCTSEAIPEKKTWNMWSGFIVS